MFCAKFVYFLKFCSQYGVQTNKISGGFKNEKQKSTKPTTKPAAEQPTAKSATAAEPAKPAAEQEQSAV